MYVKYQIFVSLVKEIIFQSIKKKLNTCIVYGIFYSSYIALFCLVQLV